MKNLKRLISLLLVVTFCITGVCGCGNANNQNNTTQSIVKNNLSKDGYKLEQVVVLSRHSIRSPLSEKGSVLDTMTPHNWIPWSSKASELSLRGGILETGDAVRREIERLRALNEKLGNKVGIILFEEQEFIEAAHNFDCQLFQDRSSSCK